MEHTETVTFIPGTITISTDEYAELLQRSAFLDVLLAAGKESYDYPRDAVFSNVKNLTTFGTTQPSVEGENHA